MNLNSMSTKTIFEITTLPKVDAAVGFVLAGEGRKAVIANLEKAKEALAGKTGTTII